MYIPITQLELVLNSLRKGILILDEAGTVVAVNSTLRALFPGLEHGTVFSAVQPALASELAGPINAALADKSAQIDRFEWELGGNRHYLTIRFNPVDPKLASRRLAMIVIDDITEHVELAAKSDANYTELQRQLAAARRYQDALFTNSFRSEAVSCCAYGKPCFELSGDFFHASRHSGNALFLIGDVQSHGIDVALRSITLQHLAKIWLHDTQSPFSVMHDLNNFAVTDQDDGLWMCCMLIAIFNRTAGALTYCRAGIPEPVLLQNGETHQAFSNDGTPLGAFRNEEYEEHTISISPGDRLLLFSDGVTEARRAVDRSQLYGRERLLQDYHRLLSTGNGHHCEVIIKQLEAFCGGDEFEDDVTLAEIIFA